MQAKPLIILTMRRTGGTGLASFLGSLTPRWRFVHEPFNRDRIFGDITRAFDDGADRATLRAALHDVLTETLGIKHCFDNVPHQVTRALIEQAAEYGYRFLLYTRRDNARRLLSLFTAQATGAWGSVQASEIYPRLRRGELQAKPIKLETVRRVAVADFTNLGRVMTTLRGLGIRHEWLLFEELYFGDIPIEVQARELSGRLGFDLPENDPRLRNFSRGEGQNTQSVTDLVPNYAEAKAILEEVFDG